MPMMTARAIAFLGQRNTFVNREFKLKEGHWRECWRWEGQRGVGVGGKVVRLNPKCWEKMNEIRIVWGQDLQCIFYEAGFG